MQRTAKPIIGLVAANDSIHRKCAQCEEEENRLQKKKITVAYLFQVLLQW